MWKSRLIYILLIFSGFIFSQALYDSVSLLTFVVLLLIPVLSLLFAIISIAFTSVKANVNKATVNRFEKFKIRFTVLNLSPFTASSFKIYCTIPTDNGVDVEKVVFDVVSPCFKKGYFDYKCYFAYRGVYTVSVDAIEFYDLLKLFKFTKKLKKSLYTFF